MISGPGHLDGRWGCRTGPQDRQDDKDGPIHGCLGGAVGRTAKSRELHSVHALAGTYHHPSHEERGLGVAPCALGGAVMTMQAQEAVRRKNDKSNRPKDF